MHQYTSMVINMAIHTIELIMGTTQNDATNIMADVKCYNDAAVQSVERIVSIADRGYRSCAFAAYRRQQRGH